ncbi:MAG: polysaccharide pyruvyl transferase CsaB [Candidatus Firestonebacteria bacterium]|nr:polysaccharide pyruvyl transferase CsaB [Candidatus Firestonebacteria bacterium]
MPQTRKKILIFGYFGFKNLGDELILLSLVKNLEESGDITVLSESPEETAKELSVKAVNRWNLPGVLCQIIRAKAVVGGGGGLFQNKTSSASLFYYLLLILLAKMFFKRVVLLSQGIGPIYGKWPRYFSRIILNLTDSITVRDSGSFRELKILGVKKDVVVAADAVFALNFISSDGKKPNNGKVGVALRKFDDYLFYVEKLREVKEELKNSEKTGFVFYPFHLPEDIITGEEVSLKTKLEDLLCEFSTLDLVVGARYHSLLLAYALRKPFIGINVDTKIKYFCETHGMPCLELDKNTFKKNLKSSIINMLGREMNFKPEEDGQRVKETFSLVFEKTGDKGKKCF